MEIGRQRRFKVATCELVHNFLIKQEVEWLAENSHAPDLANQAVELDMESIKPEEDVSYTDGEVRQVQQNTPVPQTEFIKTELILDEEFTYDMNDSEANCKQNVPAQAVELDLNAGSSPKANYQHILAPAHGQMASASISENESEEFPCDLCERTFAKKVGLNSHWRVHAKQGHTYVKAPAFICQVCGASFTPRGNLMVHMLRNHLDTVQASASKSGTESEVCEVCHCIFPTEYIRSHMGLAHSKPKHKCEFCSRLFKRKYALKIHLLTHAADRKREFICDICERDFYNSSQLRRHMKDYAQKDHPKLICGMCGFSFPKKGNLKEHMLSKHLGKAQSITSGLPTAGNSISTAQMRNEEPSTCSQSFKNKHALRGHLNIHVKDRKPEFACSSCDSIFYTRDALLDHKLIHRQHFDEMPKLTPQPSNDAAVCTKPELISDEEFIDEENGKDSNTHMGGRPQSALAADDGQCEKVDIAENSVTRGNSYPEELIDSYTSITHGDKAYKCPLCPKVVTRESYLKNHISTHDKNRKRPYACEQCCVTFLSKGSLHRHMVTQHVQNRKPEFSCELCEKKFYTKPGLNDHMRTHAGVTVSCEVCGKSFTRTLKLKYHMEALHSRF